MMLWLALFATAHAEPPTYGVLKASAPMLHADGRVDPLVVDQPVAVQRLRRDGGGWWVSAPDEPGHCFDDLHHDGEMWVPDSAFASVLSAPVALETDAGPISLQPGLVVELAKDSYRISGFRTTVVAPEVPLSAFGAGYDAPLELGEVPESNAVGTHLQAVGKPSRDVSVLLGQGARAHLGADSWGLVSPCMEGQLKGPPPDGVVSMPAAQHPDWHPELPDGMRRTKQTYRDYAVKRPKGVTRGISCLVLVRVDPRGKALSTQPILCPEPYFAAAQKHMKRAKLQPVLQDGEGVEAAVEVNLTFRDE